MRLVGIFVGALTILFGLRMLVTALQAGLTGRALVRRGLQQRWEPLPSRQEAIKLALRNGLMGLLLVILGVVLIF